jgi:redox-sensing transcriptional repressor
MDLQAQIKQILAINRDWNLGIVGVGNLGSALLQYHNFSERGFKCVAAFDNAPHKIGKVLPSGLKVMDIRELDSATEEFDIEIGVITTPPSAAQAVANLFLQANVNAILNFSPTRISVPECCLVHNIDFTVRLDILCYKLGNEILN